MTDASPLTIAYLNNKPRSAGQALSTMQADEAAAVLETLPAELSASVIEHIDAWPASLILTKMSLASAVAALIKMDYQGAAAILRLINSDDRQPFLQAMPEPLKRSLQISLSFPEDTVGAQMTTTILSLLGDQTVAVAIEQLRQMRQPCVNCVFIIDSKRKLQGLVSSDMLLHSSPAALLADVMQTQVTSLSARARLNTVASYQSWDDQDYLPVLSRDQHLIGALQRKIAQSRAQNSALANTVKPASITASIANAFITSAAGLAELLTASPQADATQSARKEL